MTNFFLPVNAPQTEGSASGHKIATLVDHQRDGRVVVAFCPICDHAEEAEDDGGGRSQAESVSIAKIKVHIRYRHRGKPERVKISVIRRSQ
jgi:hypothetical protein